jgi:hypothetical protein
MPVPPPRKPAFGVGWKSLLAGWFLGAALAGVSAGLVSLLGWALSSVPTVNEGVFVALGVALFAVAGGILWASRSGRRGIAIGIALFAGTTVLLVGTCFGLVLTSL